jgi:hypothetical protein
VWLLDKHRRLDLCGAVVLAGESREGSMAVAICVFARLVILFVDGGGKLAGVARLAVSPSPVPSMHSPESDTFHGS